MKAYFQYYIVTLQYERFSCVIRDILVIETKKRCNEK